MLGKRKRKDDRAVISKRSAQTTSILQILKESKNERQFLFRAKKTRSRKNILPAPHLRASQSEPVQSEADEAIRNHPIPERKDSGNCWGHATHSRLKVLMTSHSSETFGNTIIAEKLEANGKIETVTPSKMDVTKKSDNGSAICFRSPGQTEFVRSLKILLILNKGKENEKQFLIQPFQTVESASDKTKEIKITEKGLHAVGKKLTTLKTMFYELKDEVHTRDTLLEATDSPHEISFQHRGLRASDIAAFFGFNMHAHHGHGHAHRHGQKLLVPVDTASSTMDETEDGLRTAVCNSKHNYMRFLTVESVDEWIKFLNWLSYNVSIELFKKDGKPIPILKEERASWTDQDGNEIVFIFDPNNNVTPAMELQNLVESLYDLIWNQDSRLKRNLLDDFDGTSMRLRS